MNQSYKVTFHCSISNSLLLVQIILVFFPSNFLDL